MGEDDESDIERSVADWLGIDELYAIHTAVRSGGMPSTSAALYTRWWQLETWLRQLVYVELRARDGAAWTDVVKAAEGRQKQDAAYTHMSGPDNENPLAYLDYSQLIKIIDDNWNLFEYALIERDAWKGRQSELKRIRHRIGHVRAPHGDDLARLEQTLRDLELGAFKALASYGHRSEVYPGSSADAVTIGWIDEQHETAKRLIAHADRQYETNLNLRVSRRPWASWPTDFNNAPGILWHAEFYMRDRTIDVTKLWRDTSLRDVRGLFMHLLSDYVSHVEVTFSCIDDAQGIADAIGRVFDAVLMVSSHRGVEWTPETGARLRRLARGVDYRVEYGSPWGTVDDTTVPITLFGAGGGVSSVPDW
jgi:hypothetical protein